MKKKNLIVKNLIYNEYLKKNSLKESTKLFQNVFLEVKNEINNTQKTLDVLSKNFKLNFDLKDLNKFKKYKTLALIGMGGSILGIEAIYNFLQDKINKKVYFFNDLDEEKIITFKKKKDISKVLFIVISKSGSTIETLSNAFYLDIFKRNAKNIIIISEKKNNLLHSLSQKLNLFFVEHKSHIGGRYSVLSEVGILPAYLMDVDILKLRLKIQESLNNKNKLFLKESAIILTSFMRKKKFSNLIFLNYSPKLEKLLYWAQQLIAESLGKKNKGFLPVISNVPKDHHSLLQLYLEGPKDKFFYFFSLENKLKQTIKLNRSLRLNNFLNNKKLNKVKIAQKNALMEVLIKKKIPVRKFHIINNSEETLGELFSYFIYETIIIAKLMKINPFDQPAVEKVKNLTKKNLN